MSTHQQLLYHIVFSTKRRKRLLNDSIREDVFSYLAGVCKRLDGFALEVGGYYDHAHLLVRIPARVAVSEFVGKIKSNTSKHLNEGKPLGVPFAWQDGYGAFSVSPSNKAAVSRYIRGQMDHHRKRSFEEEYLQLLMKHEVEFDERYVFD
ncbi:MAG: IS200/IS605 family transposase [Rhodopirellula sp. JB055]|uniref:IS200/IS605 family transposase n=1 Tax=Rhodopirellula sp. JB055 TaxID=3342846 RepID=UPI00370CF2ED